MRHEEERMGSRKKATGSLAGASGQRRRTSRGDRSRIIEYLSELGFA